MLTGKMATKAGYKCAICNGVLLSQESYGRQIYYYGLLHKDYATGERWAFCSEACEEIYMLNPLGYKPSYRVNKSRWLGA